MELSPEDALRLNVLLANKPLAIRLNESTMTLCGLGVNGEALVKLHPNCRDELYAKRVKESLSGHVLGSPGGYPVYLQRWTRMGQMRDDNLEQLLLLGEPEAVMAVVCAPGITDELARRAWWAMEDAEAARRMLARRSVAEGRMGRVLAAYLVDHLPFETEPEPMMDTVALVLQAGLIDASVIEDLWKKAARRTAYYVGFLTACPAGLPGDSPANPLLADLFPALDSLAASDPLAAIYLDTLFGSGQRFLRTVDRVLEKPPNQEVVARVLDVTARWFGALRPGGAVDATLEELEAEADLWTRALEARLVDMGEVIAGNRASVLAHHRAMRVLSGLSYGVLRPVLRDTTAIGSLMRKKLAPVVGPLQAHLRRLTED